MPALRNAVVTGTARWSRTSDLKRGEYVCRRCGIVKVRHGKAVGDTSHTHMCNDCRAVTSTRRRHVRTEVDA